MDEYMCHHVTEAVVYVLALAQELFSGQGYV
jgi:hypothetical protein